MNGDDERSANPFDSPAETGIDGIGGRSGEGAAPDFVAARRHVIAELIGFERRLRRAGATVSATASLDAAKALGLVGLADRERVADALRATLLTEHRDDDAFSEHFPTFWRRLRDGIKAVVVESEEPAGLEADVRTPTTDRPVLPETDLPESEGESSDDSDTDGDEPDVRLRTSRQLLADERSTDLEEGAARHYSPTGAGEHVGEAPVELDRADLRAIDRFVDAIATLPGRRYRPGGGDAVDARRALRASLATGGTPLTLPTRAPVTDGVRCCLLLDVSGSVLDTIDRGLLLGFAERLQTTARTCRAFAFDDGFVEVTTPFERADGDPAAALREARIDWGGGTKIGAALERLRDRHPDAVDRRTAVIVVSDGLDVGDPEALEGGIAWLAGRAGGVVWLNPLASSPRYEPRSRGMAACLPYVDGLFGFASADDLAEAARQLERRGFSGPIGYEYDPRRRSTDPTGVGSR
ncbi:VWA domain-containing protein [Natrialbaceae archaeon GCM10025810]|uniref:VWA domain-containing protein n=1 Tax=Halovalidus salilacus TaxID=3075124 RepID=UPI00361DE01D